MNRIAVALALLVCAFPLVAQEEPRRPFAEQIDVTAVLLDVIVTDAKGNQILGLAKEDFVVRENGVEQTVDSVDYFTNRRLLDQREEQAPFRVERVREERYFVFFFDRPSEPGLFFDQLSNARNAIRNFIRNEMKETDRVAIAGHDTRLKIYSDFTSDKAQLERALEDAARFGPGLTSGNRSDAGSIFAALDEAAMMKQTGTTYEALDVLANALRPIRARKNLVLFSPGIADQFEDVRDGMILNRSPNLDPMLQSLNAANVSVYAVQLIRNVDTTPLFHQRLGEMSEATGGRYFQFLTNFKPALERIENINSGYYLLSYQSRHPRGEKGFQKVEVSIRNQPGLKVTARSGYEFGG